MAILVVSTVLAVGTTPLAAFGKNKIVYDEFDWQVYRSTHFDVYFYEEERDALQKVVNFAESAYDDLSRKFNYQIPKRVPLIYYATHSAFEQTNVILSFIPEGVGAFAEAGRNRMVMPIDMSDEDLYQLIKHELTHIFEYEILYQGRLGKQLTTSPPTWFMEGLASFMAEDEDSRDSMFLRDAVVNDIVPSVGNRFGGFYAYRFGAAVFRYIVDRYDWDGLRDFIYEYRNNLGPSVERPLKRTFDLTIEEFDREFRTWLRKNYLPALITKGEPTEYGRPFRVSDRNSAEISGVPSPSGDLMVLMTTYRDDVDLALMNVPERRLIRNLTEGFPSEYEYLTAQFITTGPVMGRDVAWSPDGDRLAVFAKHARGRTLLILNALDGRIERSIPMDIEQQLSPTYSPDGNLIAFHGFVGNRADIFVYDLSRNVVENVTRDEYFDAAPVFSADGRSIVFSSVVDGYSKLFRIDLASRDRYQLTTGEWNDVDATLSPDGTRIFFASDRLTSRGEIRAIRTLEEVAREQDERESGPEAEESGGENDEADEVWESTDRGLERTISLDDTDRFSAYNIFSLDLSSGAVMQYTDVVGGAFTPSVFIGEESAEKLTFASFYKGQWSMYVTETSTPLGIVETIPISTVPVINEDRVPFLPPIEVAIDEEEIENYGGLRLSLDDIEVNAGVSSDQTFLSRSRIYMSDLLGNRRLILELDSISTFTNFDFLYLDLRRRWTWGARLFDNRTYFVAPNFQEERFERVREAYSQTGFMGLLSYPFDRYHRLDTGAGYMLRDVAFPRVVQDPNTGEILRVFEPRTDDFPLVSATFTGDSAVFRSFGPISGRRYQVSNTYSHDMEEGGALSYDATLDFRQYFQTTARSLLATRLYASYSEGNYPNFSYFGGLDTLRGYDFRTFLGDRAFFANVEFRFPLVDVIATPLLAISNIRGSVFFDVGGAFFKGDDFTFFEDGRLQDGAAAIGWGISANLFGMELHWDFARRTDLDEIEKDTRTSFWIGQVF